MSTRRAFTLVELLVASSMMVVLALAGYAVFAAGARSAAKARRLSRMLAEGQRALAVMASDIRSAVQAGELYLTALDAYYEGHDTDTMDFIAPSGPLGWNEDGAGGLAEVGYYIDNDQATEEKGLVRREDATLDDDPLSGGQVIEIGLSVSDLNLSFFDGTDWWPDWVDQTSLPRAVRIEILVEDPGGVEEPLYLHTTVALPAS